MSSLRRMLALMATATRIEPLVAWASSKPIRSPRSWGVADGVARTARKAGHR